MTRTALIVQHERLKKARRSVILVLHGGKGYGARIRRNLGLEDIVRSSGPVMVYPNALGGTWNVTTGAAAETRFPVASGDLIAKLVAERDRRPASDFYRRLLVRRADSSAARLRPFLSFAGAAS